MKNKGIAKAAKDERRWDAYERQIVAVLNCQRGTHRIHSVPTIVQFKDGSKLTQFNAHTCALADPLEFLKREERDGDRARSVMERLGYTRYSPAGSGVGDGSGSAPRAEVGATEAPKSKKSRHRSQRANKSAGGAPQSTPRAAATAS